MNRRNLGIVGAVIIVAAGVGFYAFSTLRNWMTFEPIDFTFSTVPNTLPEDPICLGEGEDSPAIAKEIINLETGGIYLAGGENAMPDEVWMDANFRLPILQNSTRNLLFNDNCFYRSPNAEEDCSGLEECFTTEEINGYTWYLLTYNLGQDCYPDASGCSGEVVEPGFVSITTIDKCQQVIFNGPEIYVLSDGQGNRYVMHATATGTPDVNPTLPEGWTLEAQQIDEPLVLMPVGESCYYNIVRDNLVQSYHQFEYVAEQYPVDAQ